MRYSLKINFTIDSIDATKPDGRLGRLVNDSGTPNQGRIQTFATFAQANVRFYHWNILLQTVDSTKLQLLFYLFEKNIMKST